MGDGKLKVRYELDEDNKWDGREETIHIDFENGSKNLTDFMKDYLREKKLSKTDFLKNHFVLITRIFDKRVKDFLSLVLKKKGIEDYCYRVEFQMRGYVFMYLNRGSKKTLKQHYNTCNASFVSVS